MEGDTICYKCWDEFTNNTQDYPYPSNGNFYPVPYNTVMGEDLCQSIPEPYVDGSGRRYVIMEAELYLRNDSELLSGNATDRHWLLGIATRHHRQPAQLQERRGETARRIWPIIPIGPTARQPAGSLDGDVFTRCRTPKTLHPGWSTILSPLGPAKPPIRIRAQGGGSQSFWVNTVGGSYYRDANKILGRSHGATPAEKSGVSSSQYHVRLRRIEHVCNDYSEWIRLGTIDVTAGSDHTLKLWAGSPGDEVDKVVVTNDTRTNYYYIDTLTYDFNRGRPATVGSAQGGACDPCNPIFGLSVNPDECTHHTTW